MALQKEKAFDTGTVANYWKVTAAQVDLMTGAAYVQVSLYLSHELRTEGKTPVLVQGYALAPGDLPLSGIDQAQPLASVYGALKQLPDFEGAQDV